VIELEDDRIVLAAVNAGMFSEERDQIPGPFFHQGDLPLSC
jgi:hypothetical protein